MSSEDDKNPASRSQRLKVDGDASDIPHADRMSTVLVQADEPTPPPAGASGEFLGADEPTPPPTSIPTGQPTPPPQANMPATSQEFLSPDEPTPPPSSIPSSVTGPQGAVSGSQAHNAEHITSTGFIPNETFRGPAVDAKKDRPKKSGSRTISIGKFSLNTPSFSFLDNADLRERLLYGGGGLIGGALVGGLMGILNAFLQGWPISEGTTQIFGLAILVGLIFAVMAALKPTRVDQFFEKLGISDD